METIKTWGTEGTDFPKPDNLVSLFEESVAKFGPNRLHGTRNGSGVFEWGTYAEAGVRVDNLRGGFASLGVEPGDAVGLIANNRPEWAYAAFATYGRGGRFVPMYEAELPATWRYIIEDAGVTVLLVSTPEIRDTVKALTADLPTLRHIVLIDGEGEGTMAGLEAIGAANPVASVTPKPTDIAGLIYTSGTTGAPKGVLLSHGNFTTNTTAGLKLFPELDHSMVSLSILPWAHSFGQTAELNLGIQIGASTAFMGSVKTLLTDIGDVRPTFLIAVPRVFNRIYAALNAKMEEEGGLKKMLFDAAIRTAKRKREAEASGTKGRFYALTTQLPAAVLDRLVFEKIRARFGGRLEGALTGSASMNPEIGAFFADIGIPVYDCYGLSETSPAVTINCPTAHRPGSVGRPIDQVRVEIDTSLGDESKGDGEIIVHGPNVMQGYHNKPEATAAVMTPDGGFRTGDRGRLDKDGYLHITGRIKEQYKLENGKYVFPAAIEEELKLLPCIENIMIHGDGKAFNIALVVPEPMALRREEGGDQLPEDLAALADDPSAEALLLDVIRRHMKGNFAGYEIPRRVLVLGEDFSLENGMLTQTMKLKRRVVLDTFGESIDALFKEA